MTGPEIQAIYFSPLMYFFYLTGILVVTSIYYQWAWSKKCHTMVKVLVVKSDGDTDTQYARKDSGYVYLTNPHDDVTRAWPISKVCAIEMLYPGDGFIPVFLQKKIKTVIVDEVDYEPILNRGSYSTNVASPDVVAALREIVKRLPDGAEELSMELDGLVNNLSTAPTREIVGDPATLGALMRSSVMKALATVSDDLLDALKRIQAQLARFVGLNTTVVYAGLGLILILLVYLIYQLSQQSPGSDLAEVVSKLDAIHKSLGIQQPSAPPVIKPPPGA